MLSVEDIERMLVNAIVADARISESVDALLSSLLSRRSGYPNRATDGVMLEHQFVSTGQVAASGVVVMIEQMVEPLRVELVLAPGRRQLTEGRVYFGDSIRLIAYGTREHRELRDRLLGEPNAEFTWKERFRRDHHGWHHEVG